MAKEIDFDYREYTQKVIRAHKNWCAEFGKTESFSSLNTFADWLGDPLLRDEDGKPKRNILVNIYNPEVRRQLDILTGPHAETMLKVFLVRRKEVT